MIEIQLVVVPDVDWDTLLKVTRDVLMRPNQLDKHKIPINLGTFPAYIDGFRNGTLDMSAVHRDDSLVRHLSYSFLYIADNCTHTLVMECSDLYFTKYRSGASVYGIVSGNLSQWRRSVVSCSHCQVSKDVRLFASKCATILESLGHKLWADYTKTYQSDSTFRLIRNK